VVERVAFVRAKAEQQRVDLPKEVQDYIALRVKTNLRELEGAVNRVAALARISREPITIDFTAKALKPVGSSATHKQAVVQPTHLIEAVSRYLSLSPSEISSQKRDRALTYARHIAMYLLRNDGGLTYSAIADLLNKKDHSTVVHACKQLHQEMTSSPSLRADIDAIRITLDGSNTAA
jgi:chromosomal replication initiator protein